MHDLTIVKWCSGQIADPDGRRRLNVKCCSTVSMIELKSSISGYPVRITLPQPGVMVLQNAVVAPFWGGIANAGVSCMERGLLVRNCRDACCTAVYPIMPVEVCGSTITHALECSSQEHARRYAWMSTASETVAQLVPKSCGRNDQSLRHEYNDGFVLLSTRRGAPVQRC